MLLDIGLPVCTRRSMIELKISKSPQVILIFRSEFGPEVAFWLEHVYRLSNRLEYI